MLLRDTVRKLPEVISVYIFNLTYGDLTSDYISVTLSPPKMEQNDNSICIQFPMEYLYQTYVSWVYLVIGQKVKGARPPSSLIVLPHLCSSSLRCALPPSSVLILPPHLFSSSLLIYSRPHSSMLVLTPM